MFSFLPAHRLAAFGSGRLVFALLALVLTPLAEAGRFAPIPAYPSGGGTARYVRTADFNGDGKQDVVVSNDNGKVTLLLGKGDGSFLAPRTIATLAGAPPIAIGDFNRDGRQDVAISSYATSSVKIYLGHGDGTFAAPVSVAAGAPTSFIESADINGDHNLDLVVMTAKNVLVLLGNGNGTFQKPIATADQNSGLIAVGDVNRDGHPDVITTSGTTGNVQVFLGQGNGKFRALPAFFESSLPTQLVLADLNGDGKLDLVSGQFGANFFSVDAVFLQRGNGDGTFGSPVALPAGYAGVSMTAVDLNGDGRLDLAVANAFSNSVSVLLNKGGGQFAPVSKYSTRNIPTDLASAIPGLLASADFNGDKRPDLIVGTSDGVQPLLNLGGGLFPEPPSVDLDDLPTSVAAVNLNNDGHLDLGIEGSGLYCCQENGRLYALFGNGKGQFSGGEVTPPDYGIGAPWTRALMVGDFNHDGKLDLASSDVGEGITIAYNLGNGSFGNNSYSILGPQSQPSFTAAGDFNGDGRSDLAVLTDSNDVDIFLGKGDGTFTGPVSYHVGATPSYILITDVNRDGKRDLVIPNKDSGDISVLLGKGDGTFQPARTFSAGAHPISVAIGDFNGDGKPDLAVGGDAMEILLGRGDGTFAAATKYASGGKVPFVAQADLRGNGIEDLVIANGNSLVVLYGIGNGAFRAPVSFSAGVGPLWLAIGDFNEDGATDLVAADGSSSTLTLLLNQGGTHIGLKSSAASVTFGTPVTFTATLAASVLGAGTPTGTVAFKDGSNFIGSVPLAQGKAAFTTTHLARGTHTITASYLGSSSFNSHLSTALKETVK